MENLKSHEKTTTLTKPIASLQAKKSKKKASFYDSFFFRHIGAITFVTVLILWELIYRSGIINPVFLSSPIQIIKVGYQLTLNGILVENLLFTLRNFFVGFLLAAAVGVFIGLIMGWYKPIGKAFDPFLTAMLGTPRIVLLPLITLWVGVGFASKVLVVFLAGVFPIILNTMSGVQNLDPNLTRVAKAFGASPIQTFVTVALPGALPQIVSGLRVGIGQSLVGVIAAEMFVSTGGIGYFVAQSSANFNVDRVFVGIVVIIITGMLITQSVKWVESYLLKHRID